MLKLIELLKLNQPSTWRGLSLDFQNDMNQ